MRASTICDPLCMNSGSIDCNHQGLRWLSQLLHGSCPWLALQWGPGLASQEHAIGADRQGRAAQTRWKKIALIGGLVLPVWDVIQKVLGNMKRTSEQRLHVVRILTTGAAPKTVCGRCSS